MAQLAESLLGMHKGLVPKHCVGTQACDPSVQEVEAGG